MTFQNMAEVTEAGAKLGILSDADMRILGSMSGELDPVNRPVQTAQTVMDLRQAQPHNSKAKETDGDAEVRTPAKIRDVSGHIEELTKK